MFSIVFPGQGSQKIGMIKEFYENFDLVKRFDWKENYFGKEEIEEIKKVKKIRK